MFVLNLDDANVNSVKMKERGADVKTKIKKTPKCSNCQVSLESTETTIIQW